MTIAEATSEEALTADVGFDSCRSCTASPTSLSHESNTCTQANMCGSTDACKANTLPNGSAKRKLELADSKEFNDVNPAKRSIRETDIFEYSERRPKRMSLLWNTPKQRKEDKRKVLRVSIQKLKRIDDPEIFLRRSVLINNTMRRLQKELREEKYYTQPVRFSPDDYPSWSESVACDINDNDEKLSSALGKSSTQSSIYRRHSVTVELSDSSTDKCLSTSNPSSDQHSSPMDNVTANTNNMNELPSSPSSSADDDEFLRSVSHLSEFTPPLTPVEALTPIDDDYVDIMGSAESELSSVNSEDLFPSDDQFCSNSTDNLISSSPAIFPERSLPTRQADMCDKTSLYDDGPLTEQEKQILCEFDVVFNNLMNTLTECS